MSCWSPCQLDFYLDAINEVIYPDRSSIGPRLECGNMLRIRREQIKAMYELRLEDSEKSFVAYFRATIPDDIRRHDDAGLRALIQRGIANAEQYGISGGRALVQFLALSLVVSPEFCKVEAVD